MARAVTDAELAALQAQLTQLQAQLAAFEKLFFDALNHRETQQTMDEMMAPPKLVKEGDDA